MNQIHFYEGILFSINTMIGSGIFINTIFLMNLLGRYSFIIYPVTAFLIFPLIIVCFLIAKEFSGKNLQNIYSYINPQFGNISTWCYSISKFATTTIAFIFSSRLFSKLLFNIVEINFFYIFLFLILISVFLNFNDIRLNKRLQIIIFICKIIPISIILYYGFLNGINLSKDISFSNLDFPNCKNFISSIIITIFSFSGFESLFAIASNVKNSEKNSKYIILFSFLITTLLYILYELTISSNIYYINNILPKNIVFLDLIEMFFKQNLIHNYIHYLFIGSIGVSVFGLGYSVMYANIRNIYYLFNSKLLISQTTLLSSLVVFVYGCLFFNNIIYLQQCAAIATIITYLFLCLVYKKKFFSYSYKSKTITILSFITGIILLLSILSNAKTIGYYGYCIYLFNFLIGFYIFNKK